jgi:predicted SPOUT superfamily RNA methylase MTH1
MPDIKTALEKALNEWEPEPMPETTPTKPYFTVTNNVTRVTFEYVRDNPGKTRIEVAKALEKRGYKTGSVSSLLGQMVKQGMMRESAHLLYVTINEYTPIKGSKALKAMAAKPQEQQRKVVTITRRAAPVAEPTPVVKEWSPNDVIDKLTVHQAIALFKALRSVLVG